MIPILYEKDEIAFVSNGLGRLRDCITCEVTEERNGIYECDFEYPMNGAHYSDIQIGRIIGVTHDDTGDIQPFDIVGYEKPIDGIVKFHCTHISYRQSYYTVSGKPTSYHGATLLPWVWTKLKDDAIPAGNPFNYSYNAAEGSSYSAHFPCFDGLPHTVRSILGGMEGSVLDVVGGEYEWDKWDVILHSSRGQLRDFTIRYGVNMLNYNEEYNSEGAYSACIPYWTDGTQMIIGDRQTGSATTVTGRGETVPLDVSDKFEGKPTKAQVNAEGKSQLNSTKSALPVQSIKVEFVRLQDTMPELANLMTCRLCDTIRVVFPDYNSSGTFKIAKIVWDVLADRYEEMELGELSTTLAEALGVGSWSGGGSSASSSSPDEVECTIASGWENYTEGVNPVVTRSGGVGMLTWACKPTEAINPLNATEHTVCTIPEGYRPAYTQYYLQQSSTTSFFLVTVTSAGAVRVSRLRNVANSNGSYTNAATNSWFPIHATYVIGG